MVWANVNTLHGKKNEFPLALTTADESLQAGGMVAVHCEQGKHRTGVFCAILLVRHLQTNPQPLSVKLCMLPSSRLIQLAPFAERRSGPWGPAGSRLRWYFVGLLFVNPC